MVLPSKADVINRPMDSARSSGLVNPRTSDSLSGEGLPSGSLEFERALLSRQGFSPGLHRGLSTALRNAVDKPLMAVYSGTFKITYNPDIFDDQYIGCSGKLEDLMPKVLQKEKANKQFKDAWINATEQWEDIKDYLTLPEGFEDEHGIALLTFTNKYPEGNPIYQQLNGNLTIAGASRKDYMEKFHFKALHFYLTRALQILKPNCEETYTTYRGSPHSHDIKPLFKFGRFTSTSMDRVAAQIFGTESLFKITTCFEEEVLIPPTEKFLFVIKENSWFVLKSTGEMCSYFNCAYLKECSVLDEHLGQIWDSQLRESCHTDSSPATNDAEVPCTIDSMVLYMRRGYIQVTDITYSKLTMTD
ncbi:unnamed protein product [Ranitomeya imitator]|uniref:NAD(P)(+)--arginine ADP-ribosyltransferase n=1 Tax=Ranitomeya imitator TaxID=111125 RepID=A0ABN9KZE4_9NEOB|nr:unnamed protein product [Ranitomeya imitator]